MEVFTKEIQDDKDILAARDRARVISEELGFDITQQLQITTSVFELGKNILEHGGGGKIAFSIQSEENAIMLEVTGTDEGPGLTDEEQEELIAVRTGSTTALRGIPAMKRMMDSIEIDSEPGQGTAIRLTKKLLKSKSLAQNIVDFLNKKFTGRKEPTISEELRKQNLNLVQTLNLYEEKNKELKQANKSLQEVKKELENSNEELQLRTTELQEANLELGDRTSELGAQNRRFSAVLQQISEGVVITDRSGEITHANQRICDWLGRSEKELVGMARNEWLKIFESITGYNPTDWAKEQAKIEKNPKEHWQYQVNLPNANSKTCHISPILDSDEKISGRIWFFT